MYNGIRCREIVSRGDVDELSIALAVRLREQVLKAIANGQFDYRLVALRTNLAPGATHAIDSSPIAAANDCLKKV